MVNMESKNAESEHRGSVLHRINTESKNMRQNGTRNVWSREMVQLEGTGETGQNIERCTVEQRPTRCFIRKCIEKQSETYLRNQWPSEIAN